MYEFRRFSRIKKNFPLESKKRSKNKKTLKMYKKIIQNVKNVFYIYGLKVFFRLMPNTGTVVRHLI